jgi:hypothetical protein
MMGAPEKFGPNDPDPWMQPLEAFQWLGHVGVPLEHREDALYLALKRGEIEAEGEKIGEENYVTIPPKTWIKNRLLFVDQNDDSTYHTDFSTKNGLFRGVRFSRADVLRAFSLRLKRGPQDARRTVPEADLRAWYKKRAAHWPDALVPPTREKDCADARSSFPGNHVPREMVHSCRRDLAPEAWVKRGRRKIDGRVNSADSAI